MISLMHDTLYGLFVDPNKLLKAAGLTQGQNVLEVGCGPGFFTVAAAELVGKSGRLYTLDINPAAVERVGQKVSGAGLTNVKVRVANASSTGLPDASVDVVFFFGIVHSLKDLDPILKEMHRILKNNGVLSAQRSSWSERDLLNRFTKHRLFHFIGKERRIYRFENISGQVNDGAHKEQRIEF
jgi:ubiquinone/menaquinone biosynthesis C-methylase UbiE